MSVQSFTRTRQAVAASALVLPLVLTGCGLFGGEENPSTTASSSKSSTAAKSSSSVSKSETSSEESSNSPSEEPKPEDKPAEAPPTNVEIPQHAPIEGGSPASPEDAAAIQAMVNGMANPSTTRQFFGYMIDNTCRRALEAQGGLGPQDLNQIPDAEIPPHQRPTVNSVSDIKVDGDTASATVTSTAEGKQETFTMRMLREDGTWKMCN
ncbi:hypothetical protein [Corynebacterium sp.]|uniref:Rv0361 family membrane protein n=1 Tax=Corynebacterium sp. TaxID=1720 RepID=UPI0026DAF25E|nr:hypothetical protein [Corynebacterium sp.]